MGLMSGLHWRVSDASSSGADQLERACARGAETAVRDDSGGGTAGAWGRRRKSISAKPW